VKKYSKIYFIVFVIPFTVMANSFFERENWHQVVGAQSGLAILSHVGESQTFPIQTVGQDEFYVYSAEQTNQMPAIYGGFIGAEWQSGDHSNIQLSINYSQSTLFSAAGILMQGVDTQSQDVYNYSYNLRIRQLLAEVKYRYTAQSNFGPYVMAGLGASFNGAQDFTTTVPISLAFTRSYENNSSKSFSYALGAGLEFDACSHAKFNIGYRFAGLGKAALGSASINNVSVDGILSQSNLYANEFVAQFTIIF